jgi:pimeloyl-ACP methyl ester carboxylesterase
VIEALKDDYRVIAPDLPGFGETGEPDKPWSLNDYAAFVQSFIEGVGLAELPFSACGHSHGGRVLIKWTSLYQTGLERLILIDSAGLKSKLSPGRQAKIYMYKAGKTLLRIPLLGEALAPLAERKLAAAGSADYRQASPLMRRTMTLQLGEDLGYCLPLIRVPTLLFWGDGDKETPLEMGKKMERDIPGAGMVVLSPAGHYSYLDQFTVFIKALRYFLEH